MLLLHKYLTRYLESEIYCCSRTFPHSWKSIASDISQSSLFYYSFKSIMWMTISTEHWRSDTDNLFQCHFAHQNTYVDLPEVDPRTPRLQLVTNRLTLRRKFFWLQTSRLMRSWKTLRGQDSGFNSRKNTCARRYFLVLRSQRKSILISSRTEQFGATCCDLRCVYSFSVTQWDAFHCKLCVLAGLPEEFQLHKCQLTALLTVDLGESFAIGSNDFRDLCVLWSEVGEGISVCVAANCYG